MVPAPPFVPTQLWIEEVRNACGHPRKWQLIDATGTAFGAYFIWDAARRLRRGYSGWALAEALLAAGMLYIHTPRLFYARQEFAADYCVPARVVTSLTLPLSMS
mgnify:CR=1 FL=1